MGRSFLLKLCVLASVLSLVGCYRIPSDAKEFLDDYNQRNPTETNWDQNVGEPAKPFETYEEQVLTLAAWQKTDHYQTIMREGGRKAENVAFVIANIPEDGILKGVDGSTVLTFDGTVKIDAIGSIEFPVVYPKTQQKDSLTLLETVGTIKYQQP